MKFLLFFYFMAKFADKDEVDETFAFYLVFSFIFFPTSGMVFNIVKDAGLMDLLNENWFYDFGEMHSRHFLTPIGFLAAIVMLPQYFFTKKYLYKVKTQTEISELFDNKKGRALAKLLPFFVLLIF